MEDENYKNKISSETFNRIILVVIKLVTRVYAKMKNNPNKINQEELEKIAHDYLYKILLKKKYNDFIIDFTKFSQTTFSLNEDLKKINFILMSLNDENIHKIYKIVKLVTFSNQNKNEIKVLLPEINKYEEIKIQKVENYNVTDNLKRFGEKDIRICKNRINDLSNPKLLGNKQRNNIDNVESILQIETSSSPSSIKNNLEMNFNSNLQNEIINLEENILFLHTCIKDENISNCTKSTSTKNKTFSSVNSDKQLEVIGQMNNTNNKNLKEFSIISNTSFNPISMFENTNHNLEKTTQPKIKYRDKLINSAKLFHLDNDTNDSFQERNNL